MGASRRGDLRRIDRFALVLCVVVLGAAVLYPTVRLFIQAFQQWMPSAITQGAGYEAILNTFIVCVASVALAGVVGTAFALALSRYSFPGRNLLAAFAYLPFTLPPMVGVISFYYLIGRDGFFPRAIEQFLGFEDAALPGLGAILLIHTYSFYVFFYAMVSAALEGMDRSLGEAARSLGAGRARTFFRVTVPMLMPALLGASLLTFMSSAASFSAPYFFGQDFRVLSVQIFQERSQFHEAESLTLTVVLAAIAFAGLLLFRARRTGGGAASKGVRQPLRSTAGRVAAGAAAWTCIAVLLLPHLSILWFSLVDHAAWQTELIPTALTLRNYTELFTNASAFAPIRSSLWMSALATAATMLVALPAAYLVGRRRKGAALVNILVMLPWALPGTVIAINLIVAFNDPWLPVYGTVWLLPLAYFVRSIPLVARMTGASIEVFDGTLIEAGQSLGASRAYCFWRIILPLIAPAAGAAMALAFATSLGEFVASILLYVPGNEPIAVRIFNESRRAVGPAFAYSVLLMLLVAATFVLSRRFTSRVA